MVPFVAESGSGQPRCAELRRARQGSRAATTEQPRDWPPRAPFAAVPFPGALTPFSGWDCSGGADSAGVAAEATAAAAAAAEQGSMFSPGQEEHCALNKEPVKYGELVVLGRGTAGSASAGSGIRAGGVRGQRFAYCYGDRHGQPRPEGTELSVTRPGVSRSGQERRCPPPRAPGHGAASLSSLGPGIRPRRCSPSGGELASFTRLDSLSACENHILKIVIIYSRKTAAIRDFIYFLSFLVTFLLFTLNKPGERLRRDYSRVKWAVKGERSGEGRVRGNSGEGATWV
ncbi:hypothetical protein J1605_000434 [Eschrichtius robustus]|uniref:Uncharacterized protein n=1 Tax=Eschrichtius robustus TaxID=9764 RepID=A0AB34H8W5_ESCRO|nr:hypothetical protein J1605_000434 [Eschrichtius robustus]